MAEDTSRWLPVRAANRPGGLYLIKREISAGDLQDAFIFETLARLKKPDVLVEFSPGDAPPAPPAGMIFHVGRSGSTVLSQLLKLRPQTIVYSEPQAVNELIVPPPRWPRAEIVEGLRLLGAAFGQHAQRPYVIKFSSWNTLFCDMLVDAFPQAPWAFNVRDPLEVAVSLLANQPGWFNDNQPTSRALRAQVDPEGASRSIEDFVTRVYAAFCDAIAKLDPSRGMLIDHSEIPAATWERLAAHFNLPLDGETAARLQAQAGKYAKNKLGQDAAYQSDSEAKRAAATPALREAVDAIARPALARLIALYS